MSEREKHQGVVLITQPSDDWLDSRQRIAYREHRRKFIDWLATTGKDPDKYEGYSYDTYKTYATITCRFHRYVWNQRGFSLNLSHEEADDYLVTQKIEGKDNGDDYSQSHLHNVKLALLAYFRFKEHPWDPSIDISNTPDTLRPKDFVTLEEREKLRDAVLEYGSVPAYAGLSPEKRGEWKRHLARRFGKPLDEIGPDDWKRANGFKYVSILYTALDAGLRPIEVGRAKVQWVDHENSLLRIPLRDSSKNEENWTVTLREDTSIYLSEWLEERQLYEKYDDTDRLWLTRHSNPYGSKSLLVLLDNLREIAEIEDHDFSWYALRHSTGTYMREESGTKATQLQLRHLDPKTTMKYDNVTNEQRRDALERM
jgi:integrase